MAHLVHGEQSAGPSEAQLACPKAQLAFHARRRDHGRWHGVALALVHAQEREERPELHGECLVRVRVGVRVGVRVKVRVRVRVSLPCPGGG